MCDYQKGGCLAEFVPYVFSDVFTGSDLLEVYGLGRMSGYFSQGLGYDSGLFLMLGSPQGSQPPKIFPQAQDDFRGF